MQTRSRLLLTGIGLAAASCALLVPLPANWKANWVDRLLDLGHVPLFAALTWCLAWALGGKWRPAVAAAAALAALGEFGQAWVRRSPDVRDFLWGVLGSLLAVVCVRGFARPRQTRRILGHLILAAALVAWPLAVTLPTLIDAIGGSRAFPMLCDFQSPWQTQRWKTGHAILARVAGASEQGHWVGQLDFLPSSDQSSSAVLLPIVRNWSGYRRLCLDFSFTGQPQTLLISVRDGRKVAPPNKRFDLTRQFAAGTHHFTIDLKRLAQGGEFSPLDLRRVQSFHLVAEHVSEPRRIRLHRIYLE